jgi:hypothetical protein
MGGLQRIAKIFGGIVINGTRWVWDYVANEPVPEAKMPPGSERWKQSERIRYAAIAKATAEDREGGQ